MNIPMQVMSQEEMDRLHADVIDANQRKERARVAAENRAKGYPEPQSGDRLYVTSGRGIKFRARAGISFNEQNPTEVAVVGELDDPPAGVRFVTVSGAEQILNDSALNVRGRNATDVEQQALRDQLADRDREIAQLRAEHARVLREARMGAKDTGDGAPARLNAARKVRAGLPAEDGFGTEK
jgi:hypothetical protein